MVSVFVMQKGLYLLTIFEMAKPWMEGIMPTFCGSYERLSRSNTQGN